MATDFGYFIAYYRYRDPAANFLPTRDFTQLKHRCAQADAAHAFLKGRSQIIREFAENEALLSRRERRVELHSALAVCQRQRATLLIAKMGSLAQNVSFLSTLMESGVDFAAADIPQANKSTLAAMIQAAMRQRDVMGQRTKTALAKAKERGIKLGRYGREVLAPRNSRKALEWALRLKGELDHMLSQGLSTRQMASKLNKRGVPTFRQESQWHKFPANPGLPRSRWHPTTVHRLLKRLAGLKAASAHSARRSRRFRTAHRAAERKGGVGRA